MFEEYGNKPYKNTARITAVHKQRYEIEYNGETCFAKLKSSEYYSPDKYADFPTVETMWKYLQCQTLTA